MAILLLSARPEITANRRLCEAAEASGVRLELVDGTKVVAGSGALWSGGHNLLEPRPGVVVARVGNWRPETMLGLLEVAENASVATPNPSRSMRLARDHWSTVNRRAASGLPVPETLIGADPAELADAARKRLGVPVVVKSRRSRMGVGVMLCREADHLGCVLDSLWRVGEELIVQRFVACGGSSLRLLVIGGEVRAAARFSAEPGEWRSNGALGGRAEAHEPKADEIELALAAASALGLGLCGVDLLVEEGRTLVAEVNPTPGFVKLEQATGLDVAAMLVEYLEGLG